MGSGPEMVRSATSLHVAGMQHVLASLKHATREKKGDTVSPFVPTVIGQLSVAVPVDGLTP